ncbi:MAG: ACP S-malonyltransferase [bacterium]|nr:ACP S-malonyltransferase [Candidatus Minthenecus merdequi]
MKNAFVFPGQGAQFSGMGKDLYNADSMARQMFDTANDILGFCITDIMFEGSDEELRQTKVTQPAVFLHSVISCLTTRGNLCPDMVAGHSLGEFSALVVAGAITFEDGLRLVLKRALAMQKCCEMNPSTMAAVLGLADEVAEDVCSRINGIVVPANYNCPGQLVISGTNEAIDEACIKMKEAGAKRAIKLAVGGAFHSPLMENARIELAAAIESTTYRNPTCPVYQNVDARPHIVADEIKANSIAQLTSPVRWTASVQNMIADGATHFYEYGPGEVLRGLIRKINKEVTLNE